MEFQCRVIVQRRCTSCCSSVETIPLGAKNCSPSHRNRRSPSDRNAVRLHSGIAFTFVRIPHSGKPDAPESDSQHTDTNGEKISGFVSVKFVPDSDRMYLIPQTVSENGNGWEREQNTEYYFWLM